MAKEHPALGTSRPPVLHALLHRKLDPAIPEPKRLEDVVTSTVFGTLLLAGADTTLAAWFVTATAGASPEPVTGPLRGCWFWPRMTHAEPDVVLAMGANLIIVEAKVRSGRNDLAAGDVEVNAEDVDAGQGADLLDQIGRQWDSLRCAPETPGLPSDLRAAARGATPCLFYLVDARRLAKASRHIDESRALLPHGADVRILTWQSLHRILHRMVTTGTAPRWASDLAAYLEYENLAGYVGFSHLNISAIASAARGLHELTLVRGAQLIRWQGFCQPLPVAAASALCVWSCRHAHHTRWGMLRTGADAGALRRAGMLLRVVPIAGGPAADHRTTPGGLS
jgi:hypothetical protein